MRIDPQAGWPSLAARRVLRELANGGIINVRRHSLEVVVSNAVEPRPIQHRTFMQLKRKGFLVRRTADEGRATYWEINERGLEYYAGTI